MRFPKYYILTYLLISASVIFAQKSELVNDSKSKNPESVNSINSANDKIEFKNETGNSILTITDEGSDVGSIYFPSTSSAPSEPKNKLYNENGKLKFSEYELSLSGLAGINELSDAIVSDNSVFLGLNSGTNDDGTNNKNTGLGEGSLNLVQNGQYNVAVGFNSLTSTVDGIGNVGIGLNALFSNIDGDYNIGIGQGSNYNLTSGNNNVGIGFRANINNLTGSKNTIIGTEAGAGTSSHNKSGNVFIGYQAGFNETDSNKLYIENSSSTSPLIWGDFTDGSEKVQVNGELEVTDKTILSSLQIPSGAVAGYVLKSDASGNATWQYNSGSGGTDADWFVNGNDMYTLPSGNSGIGNSTPLSKLSVNGSGFSNASIYGENPDTNGIGVYGYATEELASGGNPGAQAHNYGGYFVANGMHGKGVYGSAPSTMYGKNYGGYFTSDGVYGIGVYGEASHLGTDTETDYRYGGYFKAMGSYGIGVYSLSETGVGIKGESNSGTAISAYSNTGVGILSQINSGIAGRFEAVNGTGILCNSDGDGDIGIIVNSSGNSNMGARLAMYGTNGAALQVEANAANSYGIRAFVNDPSANAAWLGGDVTVTGNLSKGGGSFKIDHPLDPENKYLYHSFVESPDMMNIYNGNVTLDENGEAVVELSDWFEALNMGFRYQLTCIGGFAQVYIKEEISGNQFKIAGGNAGLKVSWQVTGIRQDVYANEHRIPVEEMKNDNEKGKYLYPELYDMPKASGINYIEVSK